MIWILYNLCFPVMLLLMLPYFLFRMCRRGGYARGFLQRVGLYDTALKEKIRKRPRVWIHAVSVGETFVALRFMEEWRRDQPEVAFVMSVNTSTARVLAEKSLNPEDALVYFPLDFLPVVRRVLNLIQPVMLVLTECEFWPNLLRQAKGRNCPVLLINGRMSDRSFRGYSRFSWLFSPVLRLVDCLCVQGDRDRQRYLALGVAPECVLVTGSAKYDVALKAPGSVERAIAILREAGISASDLILLGGSTWPGEEDALLDYFKKARQRHPGLKLVLVPRHAERREEVVAAIQRRGLLFIQRSKGRTEKESACPDVLLVDTTGELKHLYTVATVIFVGKSLIQHGGQNIIEPAACGKPIVVGPNMENFADISDEFKAGGGLIQVADGEGLIRVLDELLDDASLREDIGNRAMALVLKNRGSLTITVQRAKRLFPSSRGT
ncbi:MAG: 3-deoxy-D-manno-octulosonic acid transferase [bacterium]